MADEILDTTDPSEESKDPSLLESVLDTIKKMIGLPPDYDAFDTDIIIHINYAFFTLYQLGVGSRPVFTISDNTKTWNEFSDDSSIVSAVKQYLYLKVRMAFDPPSASSVLNQYSASIQELEWRIRELADGIFDEEVDDSENPENPPDEPTNPDPPVEPGECGCPDIATDEEVDGILDDIFGDSSVPPESDDLITPGECSCPDIATDEEVDSILDGIFGDSSIPPESNPPVNPGECNCQDVATDDEVDGMLDDVFGDYSIPPEGEGGSTKIATDEEVDTILDEIFGG